MVVGNEIVDVAPFIDGAWVEGPSSVQTHGPRRRYSVGAKPCLGRPEAMRWTSRRDVVPIEGYLIAAR
jgi:hypothetical protein